jgi:agmatine deiminase
MGKHFYMPAEWERHERTLMEWPVRSSLIWPENYDRVCSAYARVAGIISQFEKVTMIVNEDAATEAKELCGGEIEYLTVPHNDAWCRDNGPTFLLGEDRSLSAVNWRFNAWGGKYQPYDLDNEVAPKVLDHFRVGYADSPIVLEGGSIHVDGEGTMLTTRECLLNKNRNPNWTKEQLEEEVKSRLGVFRIIWLNRGLSGDETDGHIDNVACFARPGAVLMQTCHDPEDPNWAITKENMDILNDAVDARGRKLEIIEIPQPPARFYRGTRLTLSYLNFYFVNGGVLLPVFGGDAEQADEKATEVLRRVFPDRKIVPVDSMDLISEGGNIHCITQQMPQGVR